MRETPPTPALSDAERGAPLESWTEREARLAAERATQKAADDAARDHVFEARLARARAWGCDDGAGACLFCSVPLGTDAGGKHTHPDNGCPGPGRKCTTCGKSYAYDGKRWTPTCSPAEHEQRTRDNAWALATRTHNPLVPPPRAFRDGDD